MAEPPGRICPIRMKKAAFGRLFLPSHRVDFYKLCVL
jgi:hypothetical protein